MPAAISSYLNFYYLGTTPPNAGTTAGSVQSTPNTITDNSDGNDGDNTTAVGGSLTWSESGVPTLIFGTTAAGEPIIMVMGGATVYYLLSNNAGLDGTNLGFNGSAPYAYCFAPGTEIAMNDRAKPVETLVIGDLVQTASGQTVPVKWIGRQTVQKLLAGPRMQPVRIRAGALGDGLPHSDLTVTADHGMMIDGRMINASALVNGTTIDFVPLAELPNSITYYHIETAAHDVILANGAPAETFMDAAGRAAFDNHQEYLDLYGVERIIPEMPQPRITSQRLLPDSLKARLGIGALPSMRTA